MSHTVFSGKYERVDTNKFITDISVWPDSSSAVYSVFLRTCYVLQTDFYHCERESKNINYNNNMWEV